MELQRHILPLFRYSLTQIGSRWLQHHTFPPAGVPSIALGRDPPRRQAVLEWSANMRTHTQSKPLCVVCAV